MKILLIGANGQLGWELEQQAYRNGFHIISLDLPGFDITSKDAVEKAVETSEASVVVNASAYTAVDKAESERELAFAVNGEGPGLLALSCDRAGIPLIHVSTDYVFDGSKDTLYAESDPISPIGVYGKSKAEGEAKVSAYLREHIILRTAWLYGVHGNNFVKTMLGLGRDKDMIRVVSDQYGCPTFAGDLADAVLAIALAIQKKAPVKWGTYHYCGEGVTSWHGFALEIFERAGEYEALAVKTVEPITTEEYPTPARRPANSSLDCRLIGEAFGIHTKPWEGSLAKMIKRLY